jgi:hypothetical protein
MLLRSVASASALVNCAVAFVSSLSSLGRRGQGRGGTLLSLKSVHWQQRAALALPYLLRPTLRVRRSQVFCSGWPNPAAFLGKQHKLVWRSSGCSFRSRPARGHPVRSNSRTLGLLGYFVSRNQLMVSVNGNGRRWGRRRRRLVSIWLATRSIPQLSPLRQVNQGGLGCGMKVLGITALRPLSSSGLLAKLRLASFTVV